MKKSIIYSLIVSIIFTSFTSCSSWMKCTVDGEPGTKIFSTKGKYIATIPQSGNIKLQLRRDGRRDFLLTQQTPESPIIPMGLNYNKRANQEFMGGLLAIICVPITAGLSVMKLNDYFENNQDVNDRLKLCKFQSANSDLNNSILNASLPIDEIRNYTPREYKGAKTSSSARHAKGNSKKENTQSFGSSDEYYEYTEEFFSTRDEYSVEEFVVIDVALASQFKSGVYNYNPGESILTVDENIIYENNDVMAKFDPRPKDVIVYTTRGDVNMTMILFKDKDNFDLGLRAVKYKKDGKIVLHKYVRNKSGKYVNISNYSLYR